MDLLAIATIIGIGIAGATLFTRVSWRQSEARATKTALRVEIYEQARVGKLRGPALRLKAQEAGLSKRDVGFVAEYYRQQNKLPGFGLGVVSDEDRAEAERQTEKFKRILGVN